MSRPPVRFLDTVLGDRALIAQDIDQLVRDVAPALVAAGTTRADALALAAHVNEVATTALNTGVVLPAMTVGEVVYIFNDGANPLKVYAPGSVTIDGTAGSAGVALANAKRCAYLQLTATAILSYQLGAVSA